MNPERIMEMYEARYPGDAGLIRHISPEPVFRSVVDRVVRRKAPLTDLFQLDDWGRRGFVGTEQPLDGVVHSLRGTDLVFRAWTALRSDVERLTEWHTDSDKVRESWRAWLTAVNWSHRDSLAASVQGADTLMFHNSTTKRRSRFGKALSASFPKEMLEERHYRSFLDGIWREPSASTIDLLGVILDNLRQAQKPDFLLSVNPYDLFLMSSDCPWDSCHRPGGLYPGAPWQYMNDSFTAVLLHLPAKRGDFPWRKLGRVLVHARHDGFFLGRPYGSFLGNDSLGRTAAEALASFIDETKGREAGQWRGATNVYVGYNLKGRRSAYEDCNFLAAWSYKPALDPDRDTNDFIGSCCPTFSCADTLCPTCGKDYQREDTYERKYQCATCSGDAYDFTCHNCDEGCMRRLTTEVANGDRVCQACYNSYFRVCQMCDEASHVNSYRKVRTGSGRYDWIELCPSCTDDMKTCKKCMCCMSKDDEHVVKIVEARSVTRGDGARVKRPWVVSGVYCAYCYEISADLEECPECCTDYTTTTSSFPSLIELQTMDGPRSMCRDCARGSYDCIHEDGKHWTKEALGEHRLDEMLAMIFANESPAIRSCLEEVGL